MDNLYNPFKPGPGDQPYQLFGRDQDIEEISLMIRRSCLGLGAGSYIIYGFRGVGKTVLLNKAEKIAKENNSIAVFAELSETDNFRLFIFDRLKEALFKIDTFRNLKDNFKSVLRVFKGFSMSYGDVDFSYDIDKIDGEGDSGTFHSDLVALMLQLGNAAKNNNKCICFIFDELQYASEKDKAALFAAMHRVTQLQLPISFICAGLPQLLSDSSESKSYIERLRFIELGSLSRVDADKAIADTFNARVQVTFDDEVLTSIYSFTKGYPFFIQQLGYSLWSVATGNIISLNECEQAKIIAQAELDRGFFNVRYSRATEAERKFMITMAELGSGPYPVAKIVANVGQSTQWVNSYKKSLIKKGLIHTVNHGILDFTVPQFDQYLRRRTQQL
jgi:hypothetical protein